MSKTLPRSGLSLAQPMRSILQTACGLLLFSGGPDSTALFHLLLSQKKQKTQSFAVLHVNYGLRGADSLADEKHVRSLCREHRIVCHIRRVKLSKAAGIQQQARFIRRHLAAQLAKKNGYCWLATAHHADDQIETLIMRQARGAGLTGLAGIRVVTSLTKSVLILVRPLLTWTKVDILGWLAHRKLAYREDASNLKPVYTRNRVRLALTKQNLQAATKWRVVKRAETLSHLDGYFMGRIHSLKMTYGDKVPGSIWSAWPDELQFRYFADRMKFHGYKGQVQTKHYRAFNSGKICLGSAVAVFDDQLIIFGGKAVPQEKRLQANGAWHLNSWGLAFSLKTLSATKARLDMAKGAKGVFYLADPGEALLLNLGNPQEKIVPFGRKRARPLGEWLKANGLPVLGRHSAPVLRTLSGQILFIFDTGLSNNAEILPRTRRALALHLL